jgi:NAD(P)-dependent dehydrogenase (short-subunit alcohol dehydrogenase family)
MYSVLRDNYLEDRVALVVGGGSAKGPGIGDACSKILGWNGAEVMIADISKEGAQQTAQAICESGGHAHSVVMDATSKNSVDLAIHEIAAIKGRIDILVLVVGKGGGNLPSELDTVRLQDSFQRNLVSAILPIKASLPYMGRSSSIVAIGSINGFAASLVGEAEYALGKAALSLYIKMLAAEVAPRGIRANLVVPGSVETQSETIRERVKKDPDYLKAIGMMLYYLDLADDEHPVAMPEDVANAVYFLCSPMSRFITGIELRLDGGFFGLGPIFSRVGCRENWVRNVLQVYHLIQALHQSQNIHAHIAP